MPSKQAATSTKKTATSAKKASTKKAANLGKKTVKLGEKTKDSGIYEDVRYGSSKKFVRRESETGKFVATKAGRTVKSSPVEPRLGRARIKAAVKSYVDHND